MSRFYLSCMPIHTLALFHSKVTRHQGQDLTGCLKITDNISELLISSIYLKRNIIVRSQPMCVCHSQWLIENLSKNKLQPLTITLLYVGVFTSRLVEKHDCPDENPPRST